MNVLITRPDERGQQLLNLLAEQHIFAIHQPLFKVEAGRELPLLPNRLSSLKKDDYVFAVSKNAVDFAHTTLKQTGFRWREDLRYFAVGQRSANYFASLSEQAVRYPLQFENSEGLLALPEMQDVAGKTVLILRAETGRELFAEQMQAKGAKVDVLECYQRVPLTENISDKLSLAKRAGIDTIVATSLDILNALFDYTAEEDREWLVSCRLLVVSQRIAFQAKKLGWQTTQIILSERADNQSLLHTLLTSAILRS